jgi:hypothetical protein
MARDVKAAFRNLEQMWLRPHVGGKVVYDDIAARSRQRSNYADATESRTRANTIGMSMFPCFAALHSAVWRCRPEKMGIDRRAQFERTQHDMPAAYQDGPISSNKGTGDITGLLISYECCYRTESALFGCCRGGRFRAGRR